MLVRSRPLLARFASQQQRLASTLVVGEHNGAELTDATLSAITASKAFGPIELLVGGPDCKGVAESACSVDGVSSVKFVEDASLDHGLAEEWTPVVLAAQSAGGHTHVVAPASAFSKSLMPRVSALLDVAMLTEVTGVQDENTFVRPTYAGNAIATVASQDAVKVLTVRPTAFDKAARTGGSAAAEALGFTPSPSGKTTWVSEEVAASERPELTAAKVVVAGGRGLKSSDNFKMLDSLADKLGAAIGASRAAVDSGMCPNDMQVGQTGKVVAPDLYIAVGISGAIQHLAGMKDSKTIVAINKDPDAPIFQISDYGLVGDLFTALPELESKLK
jgi:electron transfer flavoprotein alpha subunit